jgi:hypothetical protein
VQRNGICKGRNYKVRNLRLLKKEKGNFQTIRETFRKKVGEKSTEIILLDPTTTQKRYKVCRYIFPRIVISKRRVY